MKHKLMPKETTCFKIEFEDTAWKKNLDVKPTTYDPHLFFPMEFEEDPVKFDLHVAANTANKDLYKSLTIHDISVEKDQITGSLFNYATQEVTIPQFVVSYYDEYKELIWVDHFFVDGSVRQQRKTSFNYPITEECNIELVSDDISLSFINGLPNASMASKNVPNRIKGHELNNMLTLEHDQFWYARIELNNYIGNPN